MTPAWAPPMAVAGLGVLTSCYLEANPGLRTLPSWGLEALRLPEVTTRWRLQSREAANIAPLPAQVHLGHRQQDQDGRVRRARANPDARQRLLRAGVQRPRVRGAIGSVGFKLLRWVTGERPAKTPWRTPAPNPHSTLFYLPSTGIQVSFIPGSPSCLQ